MSTGRHLRGSPRLSIAERADALLARLSATEQLLDRARLFGEFAGGVSLFAAGHREEIIGEVEALATDVFAAVLERVLAEGRSKRGVREDAARLAAGHIARAGGDGGILMGLVRDLAEAHAAAQRLP